MFCQKCGTKLEDNHQFCMNCGAPRPRPTYSAPGSGGPSSTNQSWWLHSDRRATSTTYSNATGDLKYFSFSDFVKQGWLFYVIVIILTLISFLLTAFGKVYHCDYPAIYHEGYEIDSFRELLTLSGIKYDIDSYDDEWNEYWEELCDTGFSTSFAENASEIRRHLGAVPKVPFGEDTTIKNIYLLKHGINLMYAINTGGNVDVVDVNILHSVYLILPYVLCFIFLVIPFIPNVKLKTGMLTFPIVCSLWSLFVLIYSCQAASNAVLGDNKGELDYGLKLNIELSDIGYLAVIMLILTVIMSIVTIISIRNAEFRRKYGNIM